MPTITVSSTSSLCGQALSGNPTSPSIWSDGNHQCRSIRARLLLPRGRSRPPNADCCWNQLAVTPDADAGIVGRRARRGGLRRLV